ncbi:MULTISPECIES: hypothetical protein [unclassified Curtobacterium]|uniref:hypothetical protein n=1 Tax=unclassified Curtobacterium TaxID=257496 RepID=UPI000D817BCD|nr:MULTISPECIES: hypothetical protein [unclassified Curtobacterium]PYY34455.1 hypothetical protein DEJ32_14695 [Curtobacterium sp. MCPF17_046]PZE86852.1 hypothetical protein DEI91_00660 [Curtobacterium sp. MCBD17_032]
MQERTWFTDDLPDGVSIATVMDDISVVVDPSGLVTIDGPAGGSTTLDFDDAVVLSAVLIEGVRILREKGCVERDAVLTWLRDHGAR